MAAETPRDGGLPAAIRSAALAGTAVALLLFAVLAAEGSPSGLLRRGPFTSDLFDAQAHAILDGHLDVDPEVAGIEGFVHDGRTHLYFGLVPSLLRLPVAAVTDRFDGRLTVVSMLVALAVACWAASRLLWRARRQRRGEAPPGRWEPWIVGGFTATVGLASPLLFLASRPVVYHETELWGAATTLVTLEALLRWWEAPTRRALVLMGLAALVACNTRASVGGGAVAAVGLTAMVALLIRRVPWRQAPALALVVILPVATYAAVNQARFGSPFDIPFETQVLSGFDPARQAALEATDGAFFGPEYAPTALVTYLRPDGVDLQRLFPWVTFRESTDVIGDPTFDTIDRSASLPVVAPSLVALALLALVPLLRQGWRNPWLTATIGSAVGLVSTVTIAFIANRYLADFIPTLLLPAALGTWVLADWLRHQRRALRRPAVVAVVGLSGLGLLVSAALAVQAQRFFILPSTEARRDLVSFQYDLHDRLGGGAPPAVRVVAEAGEPGARGEVVAVDGCRGLYWSDGERWWPLELGGADGLVVTAPIRGGRTTMLEASAWRLTAETVVGGVILSYEHDDSTVRVGSPVDRALVDDVPLTVALDRVNNELTVRSGDREVLVAWLVDLAGTPAGVTGAEVQPAPTPLCDDLVARLTP